ncbi:MAG: hypothetical protein E7377_04520 [Clostridiales bacterium]|nr:hypothetical protein [Clostridiales bacterium]
MIAPSLWKVRLQIMGLMPERALLRLRRAHVAVYNVKKIKPDCIVFNVKREDEEKVFAIYPDGRYEGAGYAPYTVRKIRSEGLGKYVEFFKRRMGLFVGALLAFALILFSDRYVFSVEFIGTDVYKREALIALEEEGITPFSPYKNGKEDIVCARMLALDGVEFCSVKKSGNRVFVEVRLSPFPTRFTDKGTMRAKHTGKLVSLTVLRGTPLAEIGKEVLAGEELVGNWFSTQEGEQVRVEPIARASIACVYDEEIAAEKEECAFAIAYLEAGIQDTDGVTKKEIIKTDGGYRVRLEYTVVESINF